MEGRNEMGEKMGKDDKDLNGLKCQKNVTSTPSECHVTPT